MKFSLEIMLLLFELDEMLEETIQREVPDEVVVSIV